MLCALAVKDLSVSSGKTQLGAENKEGKAIANLARRVTVAEAVLEELRSMTRGTQPFYHAKPPDRRQQNTLVDMAGSIDLDGSKLASVASGPCKLQFFEAPRARRRRRRSTLSYTRRAIRPVQ